MEDDMVVVVVVCVVADVERGRGATAATRSACEDTFEA